MGVTIMFNRAKKVPIQFVVAQGIKAIRDSGRKDLEPYADRLEEAKEKEDYAEASRILSEVAVYLDGHRKKTAGIWS